MKSLKIMHFVTGGFSGATQVAIDIIEAQKQLPTIESLLVLRQKKTTTQQKLAKLNELGIAYQIVTNQSHLSTIKQLRQIILQYQPDILLAHGFPEHLIGRWAGKGIVPAMLQIEHASHERYTAWRLWQSRYLSKFTRYAVGVSDGVCEVLRSQHLNCDIITINNGIHTQRFVNDIPLIQRPKDIVMVARFSKGKNHKILLDALAKLRAENLTPKLTLIGTGSKRHIAGAKKLAQQHGINDQIEWIDYTNEIAKLLAGHKIFVLATLYEGLSLSVIEAMAAGCVVIGSNVTGVKELIHHQQDGFLFDNANAEELAIYLKQVLSTPSSFQSMAENAKQKALAQFDVANMAKNYANLFTRISAESLS